MIAAASNLEDMTRLMPAIEKIAHKHVARGVSASQYAAIGECLLFAIQEVLQDAGTDETMKAWEAAYNEIKQVFIDVEDRLYTDLGGAGGFSGFKDMEVVDVRSSTKGMVIEVSLEGHGDWNVSKGQFVAIDVEIEYGVRTMTSMKLIGCQRDRLGIVVPPSEERASIMLRKAEIGDILRVSMPCGKSGERM